MDSVFTRGQRVASLVCRVLVVGLFAGVIHAQTPISVRELVRGFYSRYKNEQVVVQGLGLSRKNGFPRLPSRRIT